MSEHDPRCEGTDDAKLLADVQEYGWHVVRVLEKGDTPGWAFSIGLYKNFHHPEIVVFGLNEDLMYYLINDIGEEVRKGKTFQVGGLYRDLIESYACTFKPVNQVWYRDFLGYANWFYKNQDYPVPQCIWPDRNSRFPWEPDFNENWMWAQPLLFRDERESARTADLLRSMES